MTRTVALLAVVVTSAAACKDGDATAPTVVSLVVTPGTIALTSIGETIQLAATVLDGNGNAISSASVVWASSDESVATVTASGLVTALDNGGAAITATAAGTSASASAAVTVAQEVASVGVMPSAHTFASIGEQLQLTGQAMDANGNAVVAVAFSWSTSNQSIIRVDPSGIATAVSNGAATLSAEVGGISGSAGLSVDQVPTALAFLVQPTRTIVDSSLSPPPQVVFADALGTTVPDATDQVTIEVASGPTGGSLTGATTVAASMGAAIFDVAIDRAGAAYALLASAEGVTSATSETFDIAPQPVSLQALTKTTNSINIAWSESTDPTFGSYIVRRSTDAAGAGIALNTTSTASTTSLADSSIVLGETYHYWVEVETEDGVRSPSTRASLEAGIAIELGTVVEKMITDPSRSMLYAISRNTNRLYFVDTDARMVIDSVFAGMDPTDLDIDTTGDTLFVVSFSTNQLYVVDLSTRSVERSFSFPVPDNHSQGAHYHVAAGRPGRAYYVDGAWDPRIHVLDTNTGTEVADFNFGGIGDIEVSADGNTIFMWRQFGWGAGIINSWITRIDASTDMLSVSQTGATNIGRDPLDTPVLLAASDSRVYGKRWAFSAADLDIISGAFPENIYAVTPDGELVFSETSIYSGATGLAVRAMPLPSRRTSVAADGFTLLIHELGTGRIFLYDLTPF